ncbi:hypothetical protein NIES25_31100 [Nostoc linckia NIES-25]|nr:hypothetical protein NIES25_31100 [Nostoc linckia NIES-25]
MILWILLRVFSPLRETFISRLDFLLLLGKRVRGKGESGNKNPFPFNLFPFPPSCKSNFCKRSIQQGPLFSISPHASYLVLSPIIHCKNIWAIESRFIRSMHCNSNDFTAKTTSQHPAIGFVSTGINASY